MFLLNILLAYQLEQYYTLRFLKFIYKKPIFWIKWSSRQKIDRTPKIILIAILSISIFLTINVISFLSDKFFFLITLISTIIFYPFIILASNILLYPIDKSIKLFIIFQAKSKLKKYPNLQIIWITWSYGKTSTKEYLNKLLSTKFKVLATPWTHNTKLGIANFILKNLNSQTQIVIIEMWAYIKWDIQEICDMVAPNIWILTWITLQHLERFGNIENIIDAKFELPKNILKWWFFVFDSEDENILKGIKKFKNQLEKTEQKGIWKIPTDYLENLWGIEFEFESTKYKTRLLWKHNAKNLALAISVAKKLWVPEWILQHTIQSDIDFVQHRLQLIKNPNWVFIIDDSFNWNIKWVRSTIDLLQQVKIPWKKIYLTPWLVELWNLNEKIHKEIWQLLSQSADKILLIENSATNFIKQWLLENWFNKSNIIVYKDANSAHQDLKNFLQPWDLIIFQNDWTDNYI